jgi:aryl-alcohol dehydrogenase-like predicted oxidoreductase
MHSQFPFSLSLGTAQFGHDYGITNVGGRVSTTVLKSIFNSFLINSFEYIDTAQGYGPAIARISPFLSNNKQFSLITKLPSVAGVDITSSLVDSLYCSLLSDLATLGASSYYCILLHEPNDLKIPGFSLVLDMLLSLEDQSITRKLGLSIYQYSDLLLDCLHLFKLVQLPLSIYNQSLVNDGTIDLLFSLGIEIHARSIFLQGILLSSKVLPAFFSPAFKIHHQSFAKFASNNFFSPVEACFAYIASLGFVSSCVVGLTNYGELEELIHSYKNIPQFVKRYDWSVWDWHDYNDYDPRFWPPIK